MASDTSLWTSTPWQPHPHGHHKPSIPYLPASYHLQTLSVWIPSTGSQPPPDIPTASGTWIIYLHGGAWRDPRIDSLSFSATASHILSSSPPGKLAGLISPNYRLSPHPSFPSNTNVAHHPDHITDVIHAIAFLQRLGIAEEYILVGHSCGATLAFQTVMGSARWGLDTKIIKPKTVVGVNGLYDLVGFIEAPPKGFEGLREAYEEFTRGAFGSDRDVWRGACPTTTEKRWVGEWEVVLAQSEEDGLVPRGQLVGLRHRLEGDGIVVREASIGGEHDGVWERGEELAGILVGLI
ncbi:hypothetical protein OQA88_11288 [Cercophora sp. LCS_1]